MCLPPTTKYGTRVPSAEVAQYCITLKREPSKLAASDLSLCGLPVPAGTCQSEGGVRNDSYCTTASPEPSSTVSTRIEPLSGNDTAVRCQPCTSRLYRPRRPRTLSSKVRRIP